MFKSTEAEALINDTSEWDIHARWVWSTVLALFLLVTVTLCGGIGAYYLTHHKTEPLCPPVASVVNLGPEKAAVLEYQLSPQYFVDIAVAIGPLSTSLLATSPTTPTAVIFDIDETLLDNWPVWQENDMAFIPAQWDPWVLSANASALPPTRDFHNALRAAGYLTYLITGRSEYQRNATVLNLERAGIFGYNGLVLRSAAEQTLLAAEYKQRHRAELAAQGTTIVGCIGDQVSDCAGGYTGVAVKLPNYGYFLA